MTVKCENCPYLQYCVARLNDRSITGCGIPLWYAGLIKREDIQVEHTVEVDNEQT